MAENKKSRKKEMKENKENVTVSNEQLQEEHSPEDTEKSALKENAEKAAASIASAPSENNEIRETTGSSVEIYDEDEDVDLPAPPKKRFKKRYVFIGIGLIAAAVLVVSFINSRRNAVVYVETQEVTLGSIENIISVSGSVESGESKTYFSEVAVPIDKVNIKAGDKVSAGDVLFTFDEEALDLSEKTANLAIKQAKGSYSAVAAGTIDAQYAQGMTLQQVQDRLDAITAETNALNDKITEKKNRINQTIVDIQKTQMDVNQNGISDSQEGLFNNGNTDYIYRNESGSKDSDGDYKEPSESDRQMSLALSQTLADVQYALSTDAEIKAWSDQITALSEERAHLQAAKSAKMSGGSVQASKASLDTTQLTQEDTIEKIQQAKEGIKADFNGVVTNLPATSVEGATAAAGQQLVTIANLDDVQVSIQVSKSDLPKIALGQEVDITINGKPYEGVIEKISGTATKNSNGVAVVATTIRVTNPDSDIILGVEASNKIHAQKADNTIVLPYEYVQTDGDGDYVYVLENGIITRKNVVVGISSSTEAQITEGLSEGDLVITSDVDTLTEGTEASIANT